MALCPVRRSHIDRSGIKPGLPGERPVVNSLTHNMPYVNVIFPPSISVTLKMETVSFKTSVLTSRLDQCNYPEDSGVNVQRRGVVQFEVQMQQSASVQTECLHWKQLILCPIDVSVARVWTPPSRRFIVFRPDCKFHNRGHLPALLLLADTSIYIAVMTRRVTGPITWRAAILTRWSTWFWKFYKTL